MRIRPRQLSLGAASAVLSLVASLPATAQQATGSELDELKSQMESLMQGQEAIQKELTEIRKLLSQQRQPAAQAKNTVPPNTVVSLEGRPTKGSPSAQLAVIEFFDYQ